MIEKKLHDEIRVENFIGIKFWGNNMTLSLLEIYNQISIQQYKTDMGFKALVEGVHENLFVIPEYQRKYRWNKKQVEELAASLIRDLPIPPIYTFRNDEGQLEILDELNNWGQTP